VPDSVQFFENALSPSLSLDGDWLFSLAGSPPEIVVVPSAWETRVRDKRLDGPAHYQRDFDLPADWLDGRRVYFEAGAISFHTGLTVNGRSAGEHQGMWSPFQFDITDLLWPGRNTLELEVWKPGDRFPLRESLAGFLPDVATAFGGPWQSLCLRPFDAALADLQVQSLSDGRLRVRGRLAWLRQRAFGSGPTASVQVTISGQPHSAAVPLDSEGSFLAEMSVSGLPRWRPGAPALHTVSISVELDGVLAARAERRVGLRDVHVSGSNAWLDGCPLHLRGVLDWGWHSDLIAPAPPRERVLRQFQQARALGFNLVKLCLFVPDEATFDAADEAGMYLWLELPLWLPQVTPGLRALALAEYAALLRRLHHHPSLAVLSLGCELNSQAGADFLAELHALARTWLPNVFLCDNSGSAEAYGGVVTALSDFYDYHFYTDPHFFQSLVDHFDRPYRLARPWLYGEFCDADTGRDFGRLQPEPWWLMDPLRIVLDELHALRDHRPRLAAAGITDGAAALTRAGRAQATAIRKYMLELTRVQSATGGYVLTGWADTPITTSGIVDDHGELKFDPAEWRDFNADGVLLLDRERRRRWVGGDRPAYRDPYVFWAGEAAELHLLFSNGLGEARGGGLRWALTDTAGRGLAAGEVKTPPLPAGRVTEIAVARPPLHTVSAAPAELRLAADLSLDLATGGSATVANAWTLWVVPRPPLPRRLPVLGTLRYELNLDRLDRQLQFVAADDEPHIPFLAGELSTEVLAAVHAGRAGLVWLQQLDSRFARAVPFWREAIHVFDPHPLWDLVPQPGHADLRFYSVANDFALDLAALQAHLGPAAHCRPIWRRFDARQLTWAEYVVEVELGAGRLLLTTLRLQGGLGRQPAGLDANPMGAWLLASLLGTLSQEAPV
jgi:hypothetical protein